MTKPGPSVTSGADTQPGSDSLFPSGFGGGANVRAGGVGTTEIADGSIAAVDLNLSSVAAALAARSELTGTYARLDLPGGWVPGSTGTRRAQFAWGGAGDTVNSIGALTDAHQRLPIQIPVSTTRWRLRMRNAKVDGTSIAGAINVTGVYVGQAAKNTTTGAPTGAFTATPGLALSAFSTASDGASETVTGWVTDPTLQFSANTMHIVAMGWTTSATQTARGTGLIWYTAGAGKNADAAVTSPSLSTASNVQLGYIAVEYEFSGPQRVGIAIGDSLTEGYGGATNTLPNLGTWHQRFSQRAGIPMCSSAAYGTTAANWGSSSYLGYSRWANSGLTIDFAIVDLGSNDAGGSVALGTYQANLATVIANLRTAGVRDIYVTTIAPRSLTTTPEAIRVSYNSWLKAHPFGVLGCFDAAEAVQDPAAVTALRADYSLAGDTVHWSVDGHQRVANAVLVPR